MDTSTKPQSPQKADAPPVKTTKKTVKPVKKHVRASTLDQVYAGLVKGLQGYFKKFNFKRAVLGISGGIDSSLTLKIAVDALGAENITALLMPELGITKQENIGHAKLLCRYFEVNCYYQPINSFIMDFAITPWKPSQRADMNTKARIRAALLYNFANTENALVLGTSNKTELLLGYGTKYGDLAADVEVIGSLLKTEVIKLADHLGFPPEIVHKIPSAELSPGQTDENDLGATYRDIDNVLSKAELGPEECINHGLPAMVVQMVFRRMEENQHKLQTPPIIKI